jgi:hypothetical protein
MDVLAQLAGEHEHLRIYLERIQAAAEAHDDEALQATLHTAHAALTEELDSHMALEEVEAFLAIGEALGEKVLEPFREEHIEVRVLRDELLAALERGEAPHGTALRLCELILNHQQREDMMLFPSACAASATGS